MEPSLLPLMILLILNVQPGKMQDQPKVTMKPSSVFTGDTVTLSCDVGQITGQTIIWFKHSAIITSGVHTTLTLSNVKVSDEGRYACSVEGKTRHSQEVTLEVREKLKPVVRVDPDGRVFRGQAVTLTCDIQETNISWIYSWNKDDSLIHVSQSQEYRISSVNESHTGRYSCTGNETQGSRQSHTSDEVTLTLSGSSVSIFPEDLFNALIAGGIGGLCGAFLLIFLMVLLFCCKRKKGGGSPSPSTEHHLQNISQTSAHPSYGHTPTCSNTVAGPSCVAYVKVNLKSTEKMKRKKEKKGEPYYDTIYSNVKI